MGLSRAALSLLVPPLCAACGRGCPQQAVLCRRCESRLAASSPLQSGALAGVDVAWSAALYEGVGRALVSALKFRRLLPVAELMAARIQLLSPPGLLSGALVPVPTARVRYLARGFDPPTELATALAAHSGLPLHPCLTRRGSGRQVGRRRAERIGDPPLIRATARPPRSAVLVDDVLTTGATVAACAHALRSAGTVRVVAVTFARRL